MEVVVDLWARLQEQSSRPYNSKTAQVGLCQQGPDSLYQDMVPYWKAPIPEDKDSFHIPRYDKSYL
jgi:hypothetical protein